jgi:predicted nucleic acid-binding Zn ribbon protein
VKEIPLYGKVAAGRVALVDDEDYGLVMQYRWWVKQDAPGRAYAVTLTNDTLGARRSIKMHKLITGWPETDHEDRNGLNNQRSNLRPATRSQNLMNRAVLAKNATGFKGVRREAHGWRATIKANGVRRHLGYFPAPELAARAYDAAAVEMHGEFARLNFPDDPHHEMPVQPARTCTRPDCGKEFSGRRPHAAYCSNSCRDIVNYRRKREAQGATLRKSPRKKAA